MYRPAYKLFALATALALAGCMLASGYRLPYADPPEVPPGELYNFIEDVARNRSSLENSIAGRPVRGIFIGHDGCDRVVVISLDVCGAGHQYAKNFRVCGNRITQTDADEVTPSFPDDVDARAVLTNTRRAALLYGSQRMRFQGYVIESRRLGVIGRKDCAPVETIITYDGNLVLEDVREICR
jgi:hypothetical protein